METTSLKKTRISDRVFGVSRKIMESSLDNGPWADGDQRNNGFIGFAWDFVAGNAKLVTGIAVACAGGVVKGVEKVAESIKDKIEEKIETRHW